MASPIKRGSKKGLAHPSVDGAVDVLLLYRSPRTIVLFGRPGVKSGLWLECRRREVRARSGASQTSHMAISVHLAASARNRGRATHTSIFLVFPFLWSSLGGAYTLIAASGASSTIVRNLHQYDDDVRGGDTGRDPQLHPDAFKLRRTP
ncbi:hypothetical protein C8R46DRAFT_1346867, partial [Mycena filopes]